MRLAHIQGRTKTVRCVWTLIASLALSGAAFAYDGPALAKLRALPPGQLSQLGKDANSKPPKDKEITSVVLTAGGAYIHYSGGPQVGDYSKPPIPFDHVLAALAALPASAWPYGRLIAYYPFPPGLHSASEREPSDADVQKVDSELKAAGMQLVPASSS
jgi:hypothetical protein